MEELSNQACSALHGLQLPEEPVISWWEWFNPNLFDTLITERQDFIVRLVGVNPKAQVWHWIPRLDVDKTHSEWYLAEMTNAIQIALTTAQGDSTKDGVGDTVTQMQAIVEMFVNAMKHAQQQRAKAHHQPEAAMKTYTDPTGEANILSKDSVFAEVQALIVEAKEHIEAEEWLDASELFNNALFLLDQIPQLISTVSIDYELYVRSLAEANKVAGEDFRPRTWANRIGKIDIILNKLAERILAGAFNDAIRSSHNLADEAQALLKDTTAWTALYKRNQDLLEELQQRIDSARDSLAKTNAAREQNLTSYGVVNFTDLIPRLEKANADFETLTGEHGSVFMRIIEAQTFTEGAFDKASDLLDNAFRQIQEVEMLLADISARVLLLQEIQANGTTMVEAARARHEQIYQSFNENAATVGAQIESQLTRLAHDINRMGELLAAKLYLQFNRELEDIRVRLEQVQYTINGQVTALNNAQAARATEQRNATQAVMAMRSAFNATSRAAVTKNQYEAMAEIQESFATVERDVLKTQKDNEPELAQNLSHQAERFDGIATQADATRISIVKSGADYQTLLTQTREQIEKAHLDYTRAAVFVKYDDNTNRAGETALEQANNLIPPDVSGETSIENLNIAIRNAIQAQQLCAQAEKQAKDKIRELEEKRMLGREYAGTTIPSTYSSYPSSTPHREESTPWQSNQTRRQTHSAPAQQRERSRRVTGDSAPRSKASTRTSTQSVRRSQTSQRTTGGTSPRKK